MKEDVKRMEPLIPDIWPAGTKNKVYQWLVFRLLAWVVVSFICSLYYIIPFVSFFLLPFLFWKSPTVAATILALFLTAIFYPDREWPQFRKFSQIFFDIFRLKSNFHSISALLDKDRRYILAMHPHGIIPIHSMIYTSVLDSLAPELYGTGGLATVMFYVPILKNIFKWLGTTTADYKVLKGQLLNNTNVFLMPDGIAGIYEAGPGKNAIVLRKRRGLFRLALETNAIIIPLYCFGANDLFQQAAGSDSFIGQLSRKLRVSLTLFWGQYFLPMPFETDLSFVFCEPVAPPEDLEQKEAVEEFYNRYIESIQTGFDDYKKPAGYPKANLKIV